MTGEFKFLFPRTRVLIKGAGDLGTGVAWRLHRAGFPTVVTELAHPLVVRRTVAFAGAADEGEITVQGLTAQRVNTPDEARGLWASGRLPVLIDPETRARDTLQITVLVDAVMAKRNSGTHLADAPLVVGLGPGFTPGVDCHAVVETNRGHNLGRVWWDRAAEPNTGVPGEIGGRGAERVLRAPRPGALVPVKQIGDRVAAGDVIATVGGEPVLAPFEGILRGLVRAGLVVQSGMKIGDVDPRAARDACFTISDKALAVGGGVLEAVLFWMKERGGEH